VYTIRKNKGDNKMKKLIKNNMVISRKIDNETLILNPEINSVYTLSEIGTIVWYLLEQKGNMSLDEILHHIQVEYDVSEDQLRADVNEFISKMQEFNLMYFIEE
jgi:hypothetical protein